MKKFILHSCLCAFCFTIATSCSKDVKTPASRTPIAAKPTSTGDKTTSAETTTTTQNEEQDGGECGNNSTHSDSGSGSAY